MKQESLPFILVLVVASFLGLAGVGFLGSVRQEPVNLSKVVEAVRHCALEAEAQGPAAPVTVTLRELLEHGLVTPEDVRGFRGIDVVFSLKFDDTQPQRILTHARLPDGTELAGFADGSVHQLPRRK